MEEVRKILDKLEIKYEIIYHPAVYTSAEADEYVKNIKCSKAKNLFLAGKNDKNFYLFIIKDSKRLDMKNLSATISDRLHFGSEKQLKEKMNLTPGSVSILGLLNNTKKDIITYIDKDLLEENLIAFHPNTNTATMLININDIFKFLKELDFKYKIINI